MLRLGFHYHIPARLDESGRVRVPGYLGRFIDSLAVHCQTITLFLHSPRADEMTLMDYAIQSDNVSWIDLGLHRSVPQRMALAPNYVKQIRQHRARLDVMLIRAPTPLLPFVAAAIGSLPVALLIVGDYLAGVDDTPQPLWRREAIRLWSRWNEVIQQRVAKRALTFVNSHMFYEKYRPHAKNLIETRTTTLSEKDFFLREDTCLQPSVRLLYTGRITQAKGLLDMVEAVAMLCRQGEDVVLDLVGQVEKGERILQDIQLLAQQRNIADRVVYHGYKSVGDDLFAFYKQSDIYVLASQKSEGFPRTLWEAMAHSLPVVATSVGSIPHILQDGISASLIEPANPAGLSEAIRDLIHNAELRQRYLIAGRQLSYENTLQRRGKEMMDAISHWLRCDEPE